MQHLDEGTIHAWLDGELSPDEAARVEAHANECSQCAALVAEARGLIAASTRILTALDDVPSRVVPAAPLRRKHWYDRTDLRAAAAVLLVAGASLVLVKARQQSITPTFESAAVADTAALITTPTERAAALAAPVAVNEGQQKKAVDKKVEADALNPAPSRRIASSPGTGAPVDARARQDESMQKARFTPPPANIAQAAPAPTPAPVAKLNANVGALRSGAMMDLARTESVPGRVEGRITSAQGAGLGGANVTVQGTNLSVASDSSGRFQSDNVPAGEHRLIVRRIGYVVQTVPVSVSDRVATADVTLNPSPTTLDEAVVTAVATTTSGLHSIREDTTQGTRRVVYEISPGVQVTLTETPADTGMNRDLGLDQREKRAPPSRTNNTISWSDGGKRYTLTGPLSTSDLEAIKARLMKAKR
jgi:anti-sigma factor RsiW